MAELNRTHDADATSWVASANTAETEFPIQNLPLSVFRRREQTDSYRVGVAIGEQVLDLGAVAGMGLFSGLAVDAAWACARPKLDAFLDLGPGAWTALRTALFDLLHRSSPHRSVLETGGAMLANRDIEHAVPTTVGDYTDFYTSLDHATNIGKLFGIERPAPNFFSLPIAYHGRSSTVGVSGQRVVRPRGQVGRDPSGSVRMSASARLDYEAEIGLIVGVGNVQGQPISLRNAEDHMFGLCLLNDWSARDIQAWEMQPLGPFNAKNFATTISPWIVSLDALTPFRVPARPRDASDPLLPYLDDPQDRQAGGFDIHMEVLLSTPSGRTAQRPPDRMSSTSFKHQYWTLAQMLAHHTVSGCSMRSGDLIGSGTVSGPEKGEAGAMMELSLGGSEPIRLGNGELRSFLEDGDVVVLRGWCERPGFRRIGFGECRGEIVPSLALDRIATT